MSKSEEHIADALKNEAPLTAAKHQRDIAKPIAKSRDWNEAALAGRTVTINKPRQELYAFWRDFQNLSTFMENVESVTPGDGDTSHWVIKSPFGTVEWDSILTEDVPGELLAWESAPGADIKNAGRIEFRDNSAGRGTEVTAIIAYDPPGGDIGKLIAKLFQKEPKIQARRELRRFKQLMETGEISTAKSNSADKRP
ncbi:MAG: SRPBCC family protein [Caulobacter sp.]|nr:SRPBCC family protein [Caulobacter sp.]